MKDGEQVIDPNVLLHTLRQMPSTLVNLSDDLVHQAIGIGIDIVIFYLERCSAFVGRYPVRTNRAAIAVFPA